MRIFVYVKIILILFFLVGCGKDLEDNPKRNIYSSEISIENLLIIDNGKRVGEGSFVKLKNNTLAYLYTCFKNGTADSSSSDICLVKSNDIDRKVWTEPEVLIENHGLLNIMSVSALKLKTQNKIIIQYLEKNNCNNLKIVRRYSDVNLDEISDIHYIKQNTGYNVVNNDRLLEYNDKLYTPISRHSCDENGIFKYNGIIELSITDESNDSEHIVKIPLENNITFQEPGIVNLYDGSLLMWFRTSTNNMLISKSTDFGKTFSAIKKSVINTIPYSPSSIKNFNNDLFIVYNKFPSVGNKKNQRTPLVLAISQDNLNSIDKEYTIENNKSMGYMYPSLFKDNKNLILAYMVKNKNKFFVKIVKFKNMFK